jgi:N6-adenosine-specific RNA methylase IME4
MIERPYGGFRAIYADPPWSFTNYSPKGHAKGPHAQYRCADLADLKALPVEPLAAQDAALFMWATFPMLPEALELIRAWGFAYKTGGPWAKRSSTGNKWAFGTGYIFRSAAELLLVGTRGKPTWLSKSERNLWVAPIREHSRKPDCVREMIERLAPGPRLELFARESVPGWVGWGDEVGKFGEAGPTRLIATPATPAPSRRGGDQCASSPESLPQPVRRRKPRRSAAPIAKAP